VTVNERTTTLPPTWLEALQQETALLRDLTAAAARTRGCALTEERGALGQLLKLQSELCEQLEAFRRHRDSRLHQRGYQPREFLVAVLDDTPVTNREPVTAAFSAFVSAAEAAQREIELNREFFSAALATLQDAVEGLTDQVVVDYRSGPACTEPVLISYSA
jgi:hypothetical protein